MTATERLVINLCDTRMKAIEAVANEAAEKASACRSVKSLSPEIQKAVKAHDKLRMQLKVHGDVIRAAGFDVPSGDGACGEPAITKRLKFEYRYGERLKKEARGDLYRRLELVRGLKNSVRVSLLGKTPLQAKEDLQRLQQQLAEI